LSVGPEADSECCCRSGSTSSCDGKLRKLKTEYLARLTVVRPTIDELKSTLTVHNGPKFSQKLTKHVENLAELLTSGLTRSQRAN